jgi:N-acyl-D-aspartate/D-glutamate deacylase
MEMTTFDLIVRGGLIHDGLGSAPHVADIGVIGDRIARIGAIEERGAVELSAEGKIVTPGFVDIHTHYDGQAVWDNRLQPSSAHGVTTVVMGNCGIGFAPCRPENRGALIEMMEGVEDIPEAVLAEGLDWRWETFPEYLNVLGARAYDADVAAQLPHSALRLYVMGQRAIDREPATAEDNARMAAIAREAIEAGALGFATSRNIAHRTGKGESVPSLGANEAELTAIGQGMTAGGHGVFEFALELLDIHNEFPLMRRVVEASGRPASFPLVQMTSHPELWRDALAYLSDAADAGLPIKAQVTPRPVGTLMGHELTTNPFVFCASYRALESLPFEERVAALNDGAVRARILAEPLGAATKPSLEASRPRLRFFDNMYELGSPPNYEPKAEDSITRRAMAAGVTPEALAYDVMLKHGGRGMIYVPFANYVDKNFDVTWEMLDHRATIVALGDGGAHCGSICDASYSTFLLTRWTGAGRQRFSLEQAIKGLSSVPADMVGLRDRGRLAGGYRADLNVIDLDKLRLRPPRVTFDLPSGGRRLVQDADGYDATVVGGAVTYRAGKATGALPGRLVRGPQGPRRHAV